MGTSMNRRAFLRRSAAGLTLLGVPGLLAACGGDDSGSGSSGTTAAGAGESTTAAGGAAKKDLGKASIQFDWIKNVQFAGIYVADKEGYFAEEGFSSVELLAGGPNVQDMPVVASGKALIGISVTEVAAGAIKEGADLKIIGALFQENPFGIMSLTEKPIKTPQDMIGKKIGVQAVNEGLWEALLEINEIDPAKVTKIVADFDPTPLINGEADGWFSFITNEPNVLRAEGHDVTTLALSDFGFKLYQQVLTTTGKNLAENREAVVGATRAICKGWEKNGQDLGVAVDLAVNEYGKDLGLEEKAALAENTDQMKLVLTDTTKKLGIAYMEPAELAATQATLKDLGLETPADAWTNEILDEIYKDGPSLL